MQIQGTGEIGSTKRKFHLSGFLLIESRLYLNLKIRYIILSEKYAVGKLVPLIESSTYPN